MLTGTCSAVEIFCFLSNERERERERGERERERESVYIFYVKIHFQTPMFS